MLYASLFFVQFKYWHICKIVYIGIKGGIIELFKSNEEIRKDLGLSQKEFAELVGMKFRTYQDRCLLTKPGWTLKDIVNISRLTGGKIRIKNDLGEYDITIKQLD